MTEENPQIGEEGEEPQIEVEDETPKEQSSPYLQRYADKLKSELGDRYSAKFDKMDIEQRIDAMEATLEVISKQPEKRGTAAVPFGNPPNTVERPKTILEQQRLNGYNKKIRELASYRRYTRKILGDK